MNQTLVCENQGTDKYKTRPLYIKQSRAQYPNTVNLNKGCESTDDKSGANQASRLCRIQPHAQRDK